MQHDEIHRELSLQPHPHDILVEPAGAAAPGVADVCARLEGLQQGTASLLDTQDWATALLDAHVFPTRAEDDAGARTGEALMQLSMLERLPLSAATLAAMRDFVRGQIGWGAWMHALRASAPPLPGGPPARRR